MFLTVERAHVGWGFWLQWVLANTVGFTLAFEVFRFFGPYAFYVLFAPEYALMGVMVGVPHWLVLRRQIPGVGRWVLATIGGFAVGGTLAFVALLAANYFGLFDLIDRDLAAFLALILLYAPIGPLVGIAQWLVLRRKIARAGWWVLATTIALALFGAFFGLIPAFEWGYYDAGPSVVSAVGGLLAGAITGAALIWLLRQPVSRVEEG